MRSKLPPGSFLTPLPPPRHAVTLARWVLYPGRGAPLATRAATARARGPHLMRRHDRKKEASGLILQRYSNTPFYSQSFPPFPRTFPKHDPDVSTPSRWFLMPAAEAVRLEGDAAKGTVTPLFKIPKISQISRRHCAGVPGRRVPKVQ